MVLSACIFIFIDFKFQSKVLSVGNSSSKSQEISALEGKCTGLAASLQQEKTQNAYLQNEVI